MRHGFAPLAFRPFHLSVPAFYRSPILPENASKSPACTPALGFTPWPPPIISNEDRSCHCHRRPLYCDGMSCDRFVDGTEIQRDGARVVNSMNGWRNLLRVDWNGRI